MLKEIANVKAVGLVGLWNKALTGIKQFGFCVVGFLTARVSLIGGMAPLGAAFTAGMPKLGLVSTAAGAFIGYMVPNGDLSTLRYLAAVLAIFAIRIIISGLKGIGKSPLWASITAFTVVTGVGLASFGGNILSYGALGMAEGVIAGLGAFFLRKAGNIRYSAAGVTPEQASALLVSLNLVLISLYPISLDGISLGRILTLVCILLSARYGRAGLAAVCGLSSAISTVISGGSTAVALTFCFCALTVGVLSGFGKVVCAIAPVLLTAGYVWLQSGSAQSLALLTESAAAGLIFIALPKTLTAGIGALVTQPTSTPDQKGLRRTLTMRLGFAAKALRGVSETVEDVARCLSISQKPSFANVLHNIENDACKGCSFHMYCWEKQKTATIDAVLAMSDAVKRCQPISLSERPEEFTERCLRIERFEDSLTRHYSDFLSNISAERRVSEMRGVVADQMNGIADMLVELSEEFKTAQRYDIALAGRVSTALKELDISAEECSCVVDKYGRLTVEISIGQEPEIPLNRRKILERLEETCERDFEPPEINKSGRVYYITATEKAVFSVDCGCTQFNQGKSQHCGDTCRYFFDGRGRMMVILSDGMGSGGRAAVDSAMTAGLAERLLKAGFGQDCTLKIVNSAMLYKSTDESLATLDISCIDLFSGKLELFKAGAAPTIVRRNGRTGRAECRSLPAGILNEVGFDKATVTLKEDDILVMMSDGVCTDGTDWVCAEVESFQDGGARQLADRIATAARRRRHDGHDDDITVFAAIIEKAV